MLSSFHHHRRSRHQCPPSFPPITVLPDSDRPISSSRQRPVRSLTNAPRGFEGEGFPVRRAFAGVALEDLDPFIHLDQMGEVEYAPGEPKGTPWHPHRGFETVTYMIDGDLRARDSNGGGGVITNGDTQWMTAGAGILHIERPPEALVGAAACSTASSCGSTCRRPRSGRLRATRTSARRKSPLLSSPRRWRADPRHRGRCRRHAGPGSTYQPDDAGPCDVSPARGCRIPWRADYNALVYVMEGQGTVGARGRPIATGQLAVLGPGNAMTVEAAAGQEIRSPTLDVWSLAAGRSTSRSHGSARS